MDENRTIIAVVAAVLVVFSLTVAMVVPRRNPDFPGKRLGLFFGVCIILVAAMLTAVELFGTEEEHAEAAPAESQPAEGGGESAPPPETGAAGETGAPPDTGPALEGDAVAGAEVFASAGCGSCHTLAAAGSTGAVGPNLDEAAPDFDTVVLIVTNGSPPMPAFGNDGILTTQQIQDVAAYVVQSTSG